MEREVCRPLTWLLAAVVLLAGCGVFYQPHLGPVDVQSPMRLAAMYLKRAPKPSGLFRYEYDFIRGAYSSKDSIVRQTGAGYGLAEYYLHSRNESVRDAIVSALSAYVSLSIPFHGGRLVSENGRLGGARAGATALALLTELQYFEASRDPRFQKVRTEWLRGLLSLHIQGRGFRKSPAVERESDYYNGEAWLALAHYDLLFPGDRKLERVLREVDLHFVARYSKKPTVRFYHWGAMAALKRHEATSEKKFAEFAVGQTVEFLNRLRPFVKERTNTCYSVEGLASAFALSDVVDLGRSIRRRLVRRIVAEMKKNRGFQVRPGQRTIPHGKGAYLQPEQSAGFAGAFLNGLGRPRTRIDFTQHCLSALVKYEKRGLGRFE